MLYPVFNITYEGRWLSDIFFVMSAKSKQNTSSRIGISFLIKFKKGGIRTGLMNKTFVQRLNHSKSLPKNFSWNRKSLLVQLHGVASRCTYFGALFCVLTTAFIVYNNFNASVKKLRQNKYQISRYQSDGLYIVFMKV